MGTPAVPVRRGRYRGVFPFLRTARGVSIPARGVHGFLLRPFYALVGNLRFSEARASVAWIPGPAAYGSPRGDFFLRHSVLLNALSPPWRGGPLAPASSAPASAPSRERSAHRTRIEAGPQGPSILDVSLLSGRTQACHAHLAAAENRSSETGLKRNLGLVSEGHLTGVGRPV